MALNTPEELINDIRLGKMVILMDDEDRENEGDLVIAAECVKPEDINFMATHARGLICLTLTEHRCRQLQLPLMVQDNQDEMQTNFTVSIEAALGVTTGISAADRAQTVRAAVARGAKPEDIVQPGHIFPLKAQLGGVLTRAGHTEAGCDLARLAGFEAASAIVEIMNEDGTMARRADLEAFAEKHKLKIGTIADLIHYRVLHEKTIEQIKTGTIKTDYGEFTMQTFKDRLHGDVHFVLSMGDITPEEPTLVRVHLANVVRDVICAQSPERNGWNMHRTMEYVAREGKGVIVLLSHHETPGALLFSSDVVLGNQPIPEIPKQGTHRANMTVGLGSQLLREVGVGRMRLMGQPVRYSAISGFDLEVTEFIACDDVE